MMKKGMNLIIIRSMNVQEVPFVDVSKMRQIYVGLLWVMQGR